MAQYRYLFYDLNNPQTAISELPLTNVSFTSQLNSAGTLSADLLITDTNEQLMSIGRATQPAAAAVYVERSDPDNGVGRSLIWGGVVWGREYNASTQRISIQAREFESLLEKGFVDPTIIAANAVPSTPVTVTEDTFALIDFIMHSSGSDNLISYPFISSGQTASVVYTFTEFKTAFQAISDLAQGNNGFDFNVNVYWDTDPTSPTYGRPANYLNFAYPRLGYVYSASDKNAPMLQLPGNIIDYSYFEDGSLAANEVYTVGANALWGEAITFPDNYPLLGAAFNFGDVTSQALLDALALGRNNAYQYPPVTMKVTQSATQQPYIGFLNPGDDVRVKINDARFPSGMDTVFRVSTLTITPNESGGPEQITYALTAPANFYN